MLYLSLMKSAHGRRTYTRTSLPKRGVGTLLHFNHESASMSCLQWLNALYTSIRQTIMYDEAASALKVKSWRRIGQGKLMNGEAREHRRLQIADFWTFLASTQFVIILSLLLLFWGENLGMRLYKCHLSKVLYMYFCHLSKVCMCLCPLSCIVLTRKPTTMCLFCSCIYIPLLVVYRQ